jgi:hypothetical protein
MLQRNILLAFLSTLNQITTSRNIVDILLHFIKLKKRSHNLNKKLVEKDNTALLFSSISILNHSKEKNEFADADLRLKRQFYQI